jgi:hypothetical protein
MSVGGSWDETGIPIKVLPNEHFLRGLQMSGAGKIPNVDIASHLLVIALLSSKSCHVKCVERSDSMRTSYFGNEAIHDRSLLL